MKKIFFISFEGATNTIFESQVIQHCSYLFNQGYDVNLHLFCTNNDSYNNTIQFFNGLKVNFGFKVIKAFSQKLPLSELINSYILIKSIGFHNCNIVIHARADYAALIACISKIILKNLTVIWDCRGDTFSEQKLYSTQSFTLFLKLFIIKLRIFLIKFFSDKIIFVSESLLQKINPNKPSFVIPCLTNSNLFYYDKLSVNEITRQSLGISNESIIFIYSGGVNGGYHIFDKVVELSEIISKQVPNSFFIYLTPDTVSANHLLKNNSFNFLILNAEFSLVGSYLLISDFAIFLRDQSDVNYVASPVKFAEYCLAGLPIIMSSAVEQSTTYAKYFGNFIYIDINNISSFRFNYSIKYNRLEIANNAMKIFDRERYVLIYKEIYK